MAAVGRDVGAAGWLVPVLKLQNACSVQVSLTVLHGFRVIVHESTLFLLMTHTCCWPTSRPAA